MDRELFPPLGPVYHGEAIIFTQIGFSQKVKFQIHWIPPLAAEAIKKPGMTQGQGCQKEISHTHRESTGGNTEFHSWEGMPNGYEGTMANIVFPSLYAIAIEFDIQNP